MGLYAQPMASIQSGRKTVEVRLNDEKEGKSKSEIPSTLQKFLVKMKR